MLLEACHAYGKVRRFIYMSTDEVFGAAEQQAGEVPEGGLRQVVAACCSGRGGARGGGALTALWLSAVCCHKWQETVHPDKPPCLSWLHSTQYACSI